METDPADNSALRDKPPGLFRRILNRVRAVSWSVLGRDVLVAGVVGGVLLWGQARIDDDRNDREDTREDLRFVRERSSPDRMDRPFFGMSLKRQNLSGLRLSYADFRMAELEGAMVQFADLTHADFSFANLAGADFGASDLRNATFNTTDLSGVDFFEADLRGAKFDAIFHRVRLLHADLRGVDLSNVSFQGTSVDDICHDESTKWPPGVAPPPAEQSSCEMWTGDWGLRPG